MSCICVICLKACQCCADRAQAAEVLIKHGKADLEAEDDVGRTAVSHAAKYGSVDCLNLLGNAHADVFHKDREGKTPLQIAEISSRSEAVLALKKWQSVSTPFIMCFLMTLLRLAHLLCPTLPWPPVYALIAC